MSIPNIRLIISGFALLLFAIIIAITARSNFSYIPGCLGLFFIIVSCVVKDGTGEK